MCAKNSIESIFQEKLDLLHDEIVNFAVIVPLVGKTSAGKSRLLNTWLGTDILGIDTLPETTIATELRYGSPEKLILHDLHGNTEEKSVGHLKTLSKNTKDILFAELYLDNIKLKHRPSLVLVDMPGIGSSYENHTKAIINYVQRGHYYVLVMDVQHYSDADVLRFVRELTAYKQNFSAVVTKSGRKLPEQLTAIKNTVKELFQERTGNEVVVGSVECDPPPMIHDFEEILDSIWMKEASIFQSQFSPKMNGVLQDLQHYFQRLLSGDNLKVEEIDAKIAE
ncbi:MAG: dynamin family protein, partial [SAR324 cluster bacterium]|nr:dynamin family protein [SAR324 cluster bacterium]